MAARDTLIEISKKANVKRFLMMNGVPEDEAAELEEVWHRDKAEYCRKIKKYRLLEKEQAEDCPPP